MFSYFFLFFSFTSLFYFFSFTSLFYFFSFLYLFYFFSFLYLFYFFSFLYLFYFFSFTSLFLFFSFPSFFLFFTFFFILPFLYTTTSYLIYLIYSSLTLPFSYHPSHFFPLPIYLPLFHFLPSFIPFLSSSPPHPSSPLFLSQLPYLFLLSIPLAFIPFL